MSAAADLDALIASFGQYGDLITTGDTVDQMQRVIVALSDSTLNPPNDNLGNDSMVWLCKLIKYLSVNCPQTPCPNVGPELIPGGAVYADDGLGNPTYSLAVVAASKYLVSRIAGLNAQIIRGAAGQGVTLQSPGTFTGWFDNLQVTPTSAALTVTPKSGVNIGDPVIVSVKQII